MKPPVPAEALLPAEAAVLLVLGVRPAQALPPGQRGRPGWQRAGQGVSEQDITGGRAVVFSRLHFQHGCLHFRLLRHRGAFLTAHHGGLRGELVVHGDLLTPLDSLTAGGGRGHRGGERPLTRHWGVTAAPPQFPADWRGGGETALLRQREVARLVDRPRLLDVVVNGRQLPAPLHQPGLSFAAGDGAVDETSLGQEGSAEQCGVAVLAGETGVGGVPVLTLVAHLSCRTKHYISLPSHFPSQLTLIHPDGFPAGVAVLSEHAVEAGEAVRTALSHDVSLTAQVSVALEASEVFHVPGSALGFSALVGENYLKQNINLEKLPSATPLFRVSTL